MHKQKLSIFQTMLLCGVIIGSFPLKVISSEVKAPPPAPPPDLIKVSPDGLDYEVKLGSGHRIVLPSGAVIEPNGMVTTRTGLKFQFIIRNGRVAGVQLYRPNGAKLLPNETLTLPNGQKWQQSGF